MAKSFKSRVEALAKRNGFSLRWRLRRDGFDGTWEAEFECGDYDEFCTVLQAVKKMKNVRVNIWTNSDGGVFEGYVHAMEHDDWIQFSKHCAEEKQRIEDWWLRYHNADAETRKLMACGAID